MCVAAALFMLYQHYPVNQRVLRSSGGKRKRLGRAKQSNVKPKLKLPSPAVAGSSIDEGGKNGDGVWRRNKISPITKPLSECNEKEDVKKTTTLISTSSST